MKPQFRPSPARWLSRHDEIPARYRLAPRVEWDFQALRFDNFFGGNDSPQRRPGFSALAKEVLREDTSRRFRLEAAVLGLVALVSAWPMAMMIHEVIRFRTLVCT